MHLLNTSVYNYSNRCSGPWYSCGTQFYDWGEEEYEVCGVIFAIPKDFEFECFQDTAKSLQFYNQRGNTEGASADVFKGYGSMDEGNEEITEFIKLRIQSPHMKGLYYNLMRR